MKDRIKLTLLILLIFCGISFVSSFMFDTETFDANTAIIYIRGPIYTDPAGIRDDYTSSIEVTEFIKQADKNNNIKAIVLDINSPGGTPVATDEIANALKKTNKTTVALIRDVGASGAYWIASACDRIIVNRMSAVGSIGVIGSYLDFSGFIEDYNVSYERLISGKYKDMGTPFRELTDEERSMRQQMLDKVRDYFVDEIVMNRNLPKEKVEELGQGQIFLGIEAYSEGLVDELGGMDEVRSYIEIKHNITINSVAYKKEKSIFADFIGAFDYKSDLLKNKFDVLV